MFLENEKLEKVLDFINSALLLVILFLLGFLIFKSLRGTEKACEENSVVLKETNALEEDAINDEGKEGMNQDALSKREVYVDIKGAVKKPGVYKVSEDSIINDVIGLAGGLKSNASTKYTNLSKKVSNEMVITIFTTTQVKELMKPVTEVCSSSTEDISGCQNSSVVVSGSSGEAKNDDVSGTSQVKDGKVSLNTAGKEELMTLTGVGEAKAQAIIEYREKNGGFKKLEELMNISGIGEKAYEKIKDNIKL